MRCACSARRPITDAEILASDATRDLIVERGQQDKDSEIGRFPRLFQAVESIPGLTWPTITFPKQMTVWLGKREVRIMHLGRGHTAGDIVAYVPDANVVFSGDLVEYHSACYCGDAHFTDWPATLDRLATSRPMRWCRAAAPRLRSPQKVAEGIDMTRDFLSTLYGSAKDERRQGAVAEASVRRRAQGDGSEILVLRDLRALPAVQCLARL